MQTLKLGIVGAGFVAHFHARALTQVRQVEIAGTFRHRAPIGRPRTRRSGLSHEGSFLAKRPIAPG